MAQWVPSAAQSSPGETLETPQGEKKCIQSVPAAHLVNTGQDLRIPCEFRVNSVVNSVGRRVNSVNSVATPWGY